MARHVFRMMLAIFLLAGLQAEQEWRTWKSAAGTEIEARLTSTQGGAVTLEKRGGGSLTVQLSQLSEADRSYVADQGKVEPPKGATTIAGLAATPGEVSAEISCSADPKWAYFLYLPNSFHTGRKWPVCFVMDPGGGSPRTLDGYKAAAERYGIVLAVSKHSKNSFPDSTDAMMAMTEDVYAKVPTIESLSFSSGMSGGSRMAYRMSELNKNIAGVLACGSGGGVYPKGEEFRHVKLRKSVAVCSLVGTNDFNRGEAAASHASYPKSARLIWFPGNHDWAGSQWIEEGMAHIYGTALIANRDRALDPLRAEYAATQLAYAKNFEESEPWKAARWAEFLASFPSGAGAAKDAAALAATLKRNPTAKRGLDAENEAYKFAAKHFHHRDNTPDPSRQNAAAKLVEKFAGLPLADTLKRMGDPSVGP